MAATRPVAAIDSSAMIDAMQTDPAQLAAALVDAPALAADPRPGTRTLAETALGALGIQLLACDADAAVARVPVVAARDGGFATLLVAAETAASTAANLRAGTGRRAFGAELDAARIHSGEPGDAALVVATLLLEDASRHVWRVTAWSTSGHQLLEGRCTLGVVAAPAG